MKAHRTTHADRPPAAMETAPEGHFQQEWGNDAMQDLVRGAAGALTPTVAAALGACFGPDLGAVNVEPGWAADAEAVGGEAFTVGNRVNLAGNRVSERDPHALELVGHEVAHALAGGGSGEELLSSDADPGEQAADRAGRAFAGWVAGGMRGSAPRLTPATGGRAAIHRFEGSEHADAVDGATERLRASGDPELVEKADKAKGILDSGKKIKLGNDVEMTPGEVTALMGDMYGVYGADGKLDPAASFRQLYNADPDESKELLRLLHKEQGGETIAPEEWDDATKARKADKLRLEDPETGAVTEYDQLSYLDLAKRNHTHFSGPTMEGGQDNMGMYTELHRMALEEADRQRDLPADQRDPNLVRALEASSDHFLTDRHAGGHQIDKLAVMDAARPLKSTEDAAGAAAIDAIGGPGSALNLCVKSVHDHYNDDGAAVSNENGEHWTAYGDGHWNDPANADNRLRAADSVATSAGEVQAVLDGDEAPCDLADRGYGAYSTVPKWNPALEAEAEGMARDHSFGRVMAPIAGKYVLDKAEHAEKQIAKDVSDSWEDTKGEYRRLNNWIKSGYGQLPGQ